MYCLKHEQQCFIGFKNTRRSRVFLNPINTCCEFFERLQKHSTKSVCLGSPNKGSNCEGKILAYKKNKLCLISILYSGAQAAEGRQEEPHTHIREKKETYELIFSCVSWLAVLLVGAYARRRRRRRWSRATWRPCSS